MLVKDLMSTNVITVTPETKISEVAQLIHSHHFTGVPVLNADGRVVGTISESDFITANSDIYLPTYINMLGNIDYVQGAKKQLPHVVEQIVNATAQDIMNKDVPFANPEMSIEQLAVLFAEKKANPIPVTDANNRLMGIISRSDLIKFFTPAEVRNSFMSSTTTTTAAGKKRMIDEKVAFTQDHFMSKFAYVAKARANIWLTAIIVLFVVGFLAGIIYVADPRIFTTKEAPDPAQMFMQE